MKKEASAKSRKWLYTVIVLAAVLAVAGIVLAVILLGQQTAPASETGCAQLYWNIDRLAYTENSESGLTTREPLEDGLYHIRFALDGKQVELATTDKRLVNYIDSMDVMGLVLDSQGMIVEALDPETVAVKIAKEYYVVSSENGTVILNSSKAVNGMQLVLDITDQTAIYNVDPRAQVVGGSDECLPMDLVYVFGDAQGAVTHIFIKERSPEADIYLRIDRFYDSARGITTRVPDENGIYTILFAHDGQQVELKCKDAEVVGRIDAGTDAKRHLGLLFDADGYIIDCIAAESALRGRLLCANYNITAIDGTSVTAERLMSGGEQGTVCTFRLTDDTKIYTEDIGCVYDFVGQTVDALKVTDRVICYTDLETNAVLIFITNRLADSPMYYNNSRKYDGTASTRQPDASGYYHFEMTADGKAYNLKTKDKAIVELIDANIYQMMGLELDGSVITHYYDPSCISGWTQFGQGRYVTEAMGAIYTIASSSDFNSKANYLTSENSVIYDVTGDFNVEYGSATTLQKYDRVSGFRNVYGQISHAVVMTRYHEDTKLYYNLSRQYDAEREVTTRQPDAEGYYVYEMICEGKTVTVKTRNKTLASVIDKQNAPIVAMKVSSSGIITEAYQAISGIPYATKAYNYCYVGKVNEEGKLEAYYYDEGVRKSSANLYEIAQDCVIYNVSKVYNKYRGEKTTLQADDRIQAFYDRETQKVTMIFVMERKVTSELYWHVKPCYNSVKQETTRLPDENGWYTFELAVNGSIKTFKTNDKAIANAVDARGSTSAFTLRLKGDVILGVYDATAARGLYAQPGGFRDVMELSGNKATLVRNRPAAEDCGQTTELKFAKSCKYYDVSSYAENFGAATQIGLGDRLKVYTNYQNEVVYCYVVNKHVRREGHVSFCEHCGKEVFWEPFNGSFYQADGHYYLPASRELKETSVGFSDASMPKYDIVLDLNGNTLSSQKRNFIVYCTFTVMDSVGTGGMTAMGIGNQGGNMLAIQGGVLNIYGGTFTSAQNSPDTRNGGVLFVASGSVINMYGGKVLGGHVFGNGGCVYAREGTFNLYGGTISGGTAAGKGATIYSTLSTVNIAGGTVEGEYYVDRETKLSLSGSPVIRGTGLVFAEGSAVNTVELTRGASVTVGSNGAFTQKLTDAQRLSAFFKPAADCAKIVIRDGVLHCQTDFTAPLTFAEGKTEAVCPACSKMVQWTALTAESTTLTKDSHYYLAEDITYQGTRPYLRATTVNDEMGTVCLHLNGHNITAENALVIEVCKGTWNVMGSGTVTGKRSTTSVTDAATILAIYAAGKLNLYSGTFTKTQENMVNPVVVQRNGVINLYENAAVESADCGIRLYVSNGGDKPQFYLNGGTVAGDVAVDAGAFLPSGGTVSGDVTLGSMDVNKTSSDTTPITCYGTLDMSGGQITGSVDVKNAETVKLSGVPVISGCMNVAQKVTISVEGLTEGADVTVFATGAFARCDDAKGAVSYFKPASTGDAVKAVDTMLVYEMTERTVTEALAFIGNSNKAVCPVCDKVVVWTALDQSTYGAAGYGTIKNDGEHLYLAEDIIYSGEDKAFITAPGQITMTTGKIACLHLNGHSITATKHRAISGSSGTLNVMGTGTVSGNYMEANNAVSGATVDTNNNRVMNAVNLYSGTYIKAAGNPQKTVVSIRNNGGRIRLYKDAAILCQPEEYGIHAGFAKVTDVEVVVNGSVAGSVYMTGANAAYGFKSTFSMDGGSVAGGVYVGKNNQVNLSGSPVIGGSGMDLTGGAKITLGTLAEGTSVLVKANGVFTEAHEKAADYAQYFSSTDGTCKVEAVENALCIR